MISTKENPLCLIHLGDVSAFKIEITAADISALTNYHTFFVIATAGCKVYWGDSTSSTLATGTNTCTHTYAAAGQYLVQIRGAHTRFYHYTGSTAEKVIEAVRLYSGVTSIQNTFAKCSNPKFKANFGFRVTSAVKNMSGAFREATYFNSSCVTSWDVSNVTNMSQLFQDATVFNQPLNSWDTHNVTNMLNLFVRAIAFNKSLDNWDTHNVYDMSNMFNSATSFNGNVTTWNTSKVTTMDSMFYKASAFNQNIGGWDTANVTTMYLTFYKASAFNQNLGPWNVTKITNAEDAIGSTSLTTQNYDSLLIGWASQSVKPGVLFGAGTTKYSSAAASARASLVSRGWTITDGGLAV